MRPKVLIVGGGPAGAACAIESSRRGLETFLFEKGGPRRDKVCGDAILHDAQKNLRELGLLQEIYKAAHDIPHVQFYGPRGVPPVVPYSFLTLQRSEFDQILRQAAERSGASVQYGSEILRAEVNGKGVFLSDHKGRGYDGDILILATGVNARLQKDLGFEVEPYSGAAIRAYMSNPKGYGQAKVWVGKNVSSSYGWIFPGPNRTLNVGVGATFHHSQSEDHLPHLFKNFVEKVARESLEDAEILSPPHGFPIRAGLRNKQVYHNRVLLIGETAHCVHELTGDGIGPALASGILAGRILSQTDVNRPEDGLANYPAALLQELGGRHQRYSRALRFYKNPIGFYLFTQLIRHSPKFGSVLAKVLNEDESPEQLFSLKGVLRNVF